MKRSRRNKTLGESLFWTTGWLFADLFVALTMGFLVANSFAQVIPPSPTPTPLPTLVTPSPTVFAGIDKTPIKLTINIDHNGILSGDQNAINNAKSQVMAYQSLQGRHAGVAETFGGTLGLGAAIADAFNREVLAALGRQGFVFDESPLYQNFLDTNQGIDLIVVDVFVYK